MKTPERLDDESTVGASVKSSLDGNSSILADLPDSAQTRILFICAAVNCTVYGAALAYYNSPLVDGRYVNHHISNLIVAIPAVCLLLWSYRKGYLALRDNPRIDVKRITFLGIFSALIAVCIPNFHSSDVFSYIDIGWLQSHYHLNPYVTTVDQIANYKQDPMFTGVWAWNPCPYGFAFAQLAKVLCQLGNGNLALTMQFWKLLNLGAFGALALLIYVGAKRFGVARPDLSLYLYLWSPFVLVQSLANAHNDVLMTFFVMAGMFLTCTNLIAISFASLVIGTEIKFLWIVAIPFHLLYVFRKGEVKIFFANVAIALAVTALFAGSYAGQWNSFRFDIMRQDLSFNGASLVALLENIGHGYEKIAYHSNTLTWFELGLSKFVMSVKWAALVTFALFSLFLFGKAIKQGKEFGPKAMIRDSLLLALLAVCTVSSKFHPWYILMFFPVALWLPERSELRRLCIILSCTQLFAVTYLGHSGGINFVLLTATPIVLSVLRFRKAKRATATTSYELDVLN